MIEEFEYSNYLDQWIPRWTGQDGDAFAHTLTAGLGDWDVPEGSPTNIALSSSAYYAHLTWIASQAAQALGRTARPRSTRGVSSASARTSTHGSCRRTASTATSPAIRSRKRLRCCRSRAAPDPLREPLAQTLADDITGPRGGNPWVGVLGARYLLPVLTSAGRVDVAFTAATATDYPSWGYWATS